MADGVDMALHEMSAEAAVRPQRTFEVQQRAPFQAAERRDAQRLGPGFRMDFGRFRQNHGETDAVDRDTVARRQFGGERRGDTQANASARGLAFDELADSFNEAGEHIPRST